MDLAILTESNQDLLQSMKHKTIASYQGGLTKRAPDEWDSARFTSIFLASGFFYISNIVHARPSAGNANRWAADAEMQKAIDNRKFVQTYCNTIGG